MAREEAIECAKCIFDKTHEYNITFSQTLKLFNLFIACLGNYKLEEDEKKYFTKTRTGEDDEYIKFIFEKLEDKYLLVGAIVMGEKMSHFRLGTNVLTFMKSKKTIDELTMNEMIKEDYKWTSGKKYTNPIKNKIIKK
jgi:hypothetical protein